MQLSLCAARRRAGKGNESERATHKRERQVERGRVVHGEADDDAGEPEVVLHAKRARVEVAQIRVGVGHEHAKLRATASVEPGSARAARRKGRARREGRGTHLRVEELSAQKEEPLLAESAGVDALLALPLDPKRFLEVEPVERDLRARDVLQHPRLGKARRDEGGESEHAPGAGCRRRGAPSSLAARATGSRPRSTRSSRGTPRLPDRSASTCTVSKSKSRKE